MHSCKQLYVTLVLVFTIFACCVFTCHYPLNQCLVFYSHDESQVQLCMALYVTLVLRFTNSITERRGCPLKNKSVGNTSTQEQLVMTVSLLLVPTKILCYVVLILFMHVNLDQIYFLAFVRQSNLDGYITSLFYLHGSIQWQKQMTKTMQPCKLALYFPFLSSTAI